MNTRSNILAGEIETPQQILDIVGKETEVADSMFQAVWRNWLKNKRPTNTIYWYDQFSDPKVFNQYLLHFSKAGWINSVAIPGRNWAELHFNARKLDKYVSAEEVETVRYQHRFSKYILTNNKKKFTPNLTKTAQQITDVGLIREGFEKSSKNSWKFDRAMLLKYKDPIIENVIKGIPKMELDIDIAEYSTVATGVIEYYINKDKSYCMNNALSDSRGRNIFYGLKHIFNPVGFKDARALLVVKPRSLGVLGMSQIELFVAELLGLKASTVEERRELARFAIMKRTLPEVDLTTPRGRKDLYERIWLERIYSNLDIYNGDNWTVPIELDMTASAIAIIGTILGDANYMNLTNIIGDTIEDAWSITGTSRELIKRAVTPTIYGSNATAVALWKKNHLDYEEKDALVVQQELANGRFKLARIFKDFIINNVEPKLEMKVKVWRDEFIIRPNKYRNAGDYVKKYVVYDSKSGTVKTVRHTHTKRVPDLQQFPTYFPTLLVHGIDSQIANEVANSSFWVLDIHDAFIVHPQDAVKVRVKIQKLLNILYEERNEILENFFRSVSINNAKEWVEVRRNTSVKKDICITANVLK